MSSAVDGALLGAVQGITEFLPISSDGHLAACQRWVPAVGNLHFIVWLHFPTLLAILIVFRTDVWRMISGLWTSGAPRRLLLHVLIAATPAGICGLLVRDWIDETVLPWAWSVPLGWLVTAAALWTTRGRVGSGAATFESVNARNAFWIGLWQVPALLPGVSRSGLTITGALWARIEPKEATSFSFLVAVPLIAGAVALELLKGAAKHPIDTTLYAVGGIVALVTGLLALRLLLGFVQRGKLYVWSYYLVAVAAAFTILISLA